MIHLGKIYNLITITVQFHSDSLLWIFHILVFIFTQQDRSILCFIHFLKDFADQTDDDQPNALGFQLLAGSRITILASKTSREYKV